ncbi:sulfatase-like hydrolase/transferase [Chitinophaga sp. 30R24]|uniref:sulfatase-like hydrolase/transferase n=1 Tax=Chitinophaga sp. 30R24 TaxID=3248838 RepID=UPI003B9107D9
MKQKEQAPQNETSIRKPNLLFILTDQERALMHFPPGWEAQHLTAMPRLREHGISFTNAFCNTCMCSPSRATWLTGQYPAEHGVILTLTENMTYSDVEPTLLPQTQNMARMLSAGGYNVTYIGKWHLSKDANGSFENLTTEDLEQYGFMGWVPPDAGEDTAPEHFGAGEANNDLNYINQALNFLYTVQRGEQAQPFALFLSLVNPHDVLAFPKTWQDNFDISYLKGDIQLPPTINENLHETLKPTVQQMLRPYLDLALDPLPDDRHKLEYLNFYGNLIAHIDAQINTVLDVLNQEYDTNKKLSLAENTIVVRISDHGEMGLTHGALRQKMFNMYEETISVPMVISNPIFFPRAEVSSQLISLVDLMPTINGLLNLDNPLQYIFRGADLSPVIKSPRTAPEIQDAILFTFDDFRAGNANAINPLPAANRIRGIREKRWKYAYYFYVAPPEQVPAKSYPVEYEMYDLENDPHETNNLANKDNPDYNHPFIVAQRERLHKKLLALEKEKLGSIRDTVTA